MKGRVWMKVIKKVIVKAVVSLILLVGLASVSHAVETDVDVGIEFTEITGKPKPAEQSKEPPKKAPQQPIQKIIRLPQTSNKTNQELTVLGVVTSISMMSLLFVRKNEVLKNEIK